MIQNGSSSFMVAFSLFSVDRRIRKGSITEASAPGDFKINMVSTEVSNLTKAMKNREEKKKDLVIAQKW
jgi:hypothetical protein